MCIRDSCLSAHRRFPLGSRDAEVRAAALDRGAGSIVAVHLKDTLAVGRDFPGQFQMCIRDRNWATCSSPP